MSSNAVSTPSSAPATSSERMPGRVDEQRAAGQREQLAVGRRVAAAGVVVADLGGGLALLAEERVDERGLADARRAEDDRRRPGPRYGARSRDVVAGQRRQHDDRARRARRLVTATSRPSRSRARSALLSTIDRGHAARPGDGQVALEAAQVEVAVEPGDEERDVDVRGDDLLVGEVAGGPPAGVGGAPDEGRATRQDRRDDGRVVGGGGAAVGSRATQSPTAGKSDAASAS